MLVELPCVECHGHMRTMCELWSGMCSSRQGRLVSQCIVAAQGSGFSEVIAGLEAELKSMRAEHEKLTRDNKGCYNQIRAKDRELSAAEVQLERARAILVENKARK